MNKKRLDEILLRLGYVTKRQIRKALSLQKTYGGRLGSHLIYVGFVTEEQLVHALSVQHDVPGFFLDEHEISRTAIRKLALEVAEHFQVLVVNHNPATLTVTVAAVDPTNHDMIAEMKRTFQANHVKVYVASETLLRVLITQYYRHNKNDGPVGLDDRTGLSAGYPRVIAADLGSVSGSPNGFSGFVASFKVFSLIDLLQALGQSRKTVRIQLARPNREEAEVYMRHGQIVHAVCGELKGVDAIYQVIGWGEDGSFSVEPTDDSPPDNISESNEAILMEGCRLLDESRI
jgi:hypothetical protein